MRTLIRNGRLLTATDDFRADLLIDGETIAAIEPSLSAASGDRVIDAQGRWVMPGGIDVHTHLDMPLGAIASADDFRTGHRAAAFGGTTSHIDFAAQSKGQSLRQGIEAWHGRAAGKAVIDYGFHITISDVTPAVLDEIATLPELGVTTIKLLMAYKGRLQVNDEELFRCLQAAGRHGILTLVHAENGDVIEVLIEQALAAGNVSPHWHALTRPPAVEAEATARAIRLAEVADAPLYVVHLTNAGALQAVREARTRGQAVWAETCHQYLFWTHADLRRHGFEGAKWVCSPPFRTVDDQEALWQGLQRDDLALVSTDHCPFNFATDKHLGRERFNLIPNGVPGIEDRLMLLWDAGVNGGRITPQRFVELVATNPAKLMGLYPRKGTLAVGSDADIVIWDGEARHAISARHHHMNVDYNLYEGMTVQGRPSQVFVRGALIVDGEQWLGQPGTGRYLHRSRFEPI